MKQIIFFLGQVYSHICPQIIREKCDRIKMYFFAGYKSRFFKAFGKNSTLGKHTIYIGENYISIGANTHIGDFGRLTAYSYYLQTNQTFTPNISIGNNCSIGAQSHITAINNIVIGNNVLTGPRVLITDNAHGETILACLKTPPIKRALISKGEIIIEDNVWIGEGAMIMPNVHIGEGAIIACNSVVTTDIPSFAIAAGSPATVVKSLK